MKIQVVADMTKSRLAAIHLSMLTLRCMENWRRVAGGYDEAMIVVAVVAITSERLTRGDLPQALESLNEPMPRDALAQCNISSIAAATGLNRETTRRKVNQLVERGFLTKIGEEGVRFSSGLLQQEDTIELVRSQIDSFRRTAELLVNDGILKLERKGRRSLSAS